VLTIDGQIQARRCEQKGRWASKRRAKAFAARMTRLHGEKTYVYECKVCGCWHLTTKRPDEYRAKYRGGEGGL